MKSWRKNFFGHNFETVSHHVSHMDLFSRILVSTILPSTGGNYQEVWEAIINSLVTIYLNRRYKECNERKHKNALWRRKYKDRYIIIEKYTMEKQNNTTPKLNLKRILKRIKLTRYSGNGVSEGCCNF
jgi:hypothetical protein